MSSISLKQDNPKRPGTASYERYERYKRASSKEEFLKLGGSTADYRHDLQKGFLKEHGTGETISTTKLKKSLGTKKKVSVIEPEESQKKKKSKIGSNFSIFFAVKGRMEDFDDAIIKDTKLSKREKNEIICNHDQIIHSLDFHGYINDVAFETVEEANEAAVSKMRQLLESTVAGIKDVSALFFGDEDHDGFPIPTTLDTMTTTSPKPFYTNYELAISVYCDAINQSSPILQNPAEIEPLSSTPPLIFRL